MNKSTDNDAFKWRCRFHLENGKTFVTDKSIVIDQQYAGVQPLPPEATPGNYAKLAEIWRQPAEKAFHFKEMCHIESGSYSSPSGLVLSEKYIAFLLKLIPPKRLRFGEMGNRLEPVWIYHGDIILGLLMPVRCVQQFSCRMLADARAGDVNAQYDLGFCYELGMHGAPQDYFEAAKWHRKAAEQNHALATYSLGTLYASGRGVPSDYTKSLILQERAISLGCNLAYKERNDLMEAMPKAQYIKSRKRVIKGFDLENKGILNELLAEPKEVGALDVFTHLVTLHYREKGLGKGIRRRW